MISDVGISYPKGEDGKETVINLSKKVSLVIDQANESANIYRWVDATGEWCVFAGTDDEDFPELTPGEFDKFVGKLRKAFERL